MKYIEDIRLWRFRVDDVMRYETPSDYFEEGRGRNTKEVISVYSKIAKKDRIFLAVHELIERILIHYWGLTVFDIDRFDMKKGGRYYEGMYGEDKRYKKAHKVATAIEKSLVEAMGEDWKKYNKRVLEKKIRWKTKNKR
jgi:hypothetical protein